VKSEAVLRKAIEAAPEASDLTCNWPEFTSRKRTTEGQEALSEGLGKFPEDWT